MLRCSECGRDIDALGQDNCSTMPGYPLCEDCAGVTRYSYDAEIAYEDSLEEEHIRQLEREMQNE